MAVASTQDANRLREGALAENPHAERISPEAFDRLVEDFYGTKPLLFDRSFAEAVLRYNSGNRRVNRRKLEVLAEQMRSGAFENTSEPIIISAEGILNNGQHRLLAVVEADVVVDMDVRFGIPRRVFTKTDTGAPRVFHHELALELELMVQIGLTPAQALRAATATCAEVMGWAETLGTLTPGKEADVVLLEGNPLDDISATRRVRHVFKAGTHYTPEPPVPPLPW